MPDFRPAKQSPLGPRFHYHETGDGPDINTTDSAVDDGPHDHGYATGPDSQAILSKATGEGHIHYMPGARKPPMIRPGVSDQNIELKAELQNMCELVIRLASHLHSSARFHGDANHSGATWRKCKSWLCRDSLARINSLANYMIPRNPYALREYRRNLRRLQEAIRSTPQPLD